MKSGCGFGCVSNAAGSIHACDGTVVPGWRDRSRSTRFGLVALSAPDCMLGVECVGCVEI